MPLPKSSRRSNPNHLPLCGQTRPLRPDEIAPPPSPNRRLPRVPPYAAPPRPGKPVAGPRSPLLPPPRSPCAPPRARARPLLRRRRLRSFAGRRRRRLRRPPPRAERRRRSSPSSRRPCPSPAPPRRPIPPADALSLLPHRPKLRRACELRRARTPPEPDPDLNSIPKVDFSRTPIFLQVLKFL